MQVLKNVLLAPYTTFKIGGPARFFCIVKNQLDALEAFKFAKNNKLPVFVLGGGSNVLVSDNGFKGLVIKVENSGIEIIKNNNLNSDLFKDLQKDQVLLKVASGEVWDKVVNFAVLKNLWGLENLSHIPGSSGAIAVQNVGAYGQEASKIIKSVTVFNKQTHQILELNNTDCKFGYRKSVFNTSRKGKYIIFYITFILSKIAKPILGYRDLKNRFNNQNPSISNIRKAVIEIRNKKYPFPTKAKFGNAGSFFKNLSLNKVGYLKLKNKILKVYGESMVNSLENKVYKENKIYKVPTAFLLELCELKNCEVGGAKINANQPLVIINKTGKATAKDVLNLANMVIYKVESNLGVKLQIEPELVGKF